MPELHRIESVIPDNVRVPENRRRLNEEAVVELMKSIQKIGVLTPITVRRNADDDLVLVAGRHRLEAVQRLNWDAIPAYIFSGDDTDARLWEIAENLHRTDLTVLERTRHIAEWIRLLKEKKEAQLAPPGGKQPHEKGIKAAVREIGVDRTEAQRALKIDAIVPEAKEAAVEAGLADNQSALLEVAKVPAAEQTAKVEDLARHREKRRTGRPQPPPPDTDDPTMQAVAILLEHIPVETLPLLLSCLERTSLAAVIKAIRRRQHGVA
jgi:ParB/RepB/Spo0J family partition protein